MAGRAAGRAPSGLSLGAGEISHAPHADVLQWEHLPFPKSLRDFQRLFPNDDRVRRAISKARSGRRALSARIAMKRGEPFRMATRTSVLTCRKCRKQTSLTVGTVMARTHSPLTTWFWGAYLVPP